MKFAARSRPQLRVPAAGQGGAPLAVGRQVLDSEGDRAVRKVDGAHRVGRGAA